MSDTVGIGIGVHQAGNGIARGINTLAALAKTPAYLVAVAFIYDTTLACLPTATTVYVPTTDVLVSQTRFVAYLQVAHLATPHVGESDVTLGALIVDIHDTGFCDTGITVMAQHHLDVELFQ